MTTSEKYKDAIEELDELLKFSLTGQSRLNVIKGRVAYLEGMVETYERELPLCPHGDSKELLVKVSDSKVNGTTSTGNEDALLTRKDLTEPVVPLAPGCVEIKVEPKALLDTPSVESAQHLSGTNGEKARGHGGPSLNDCKFHVDYLRTLLERIRLDIEQERNEAHKKDSERLKGTGYEMLANSKRAWQFDAVWEFVKRYNEAIGKAIEF